MRAGVSTVQQTLTTEAASILKQAVTEASKRGHAQATPLHVAATLLVSPSSPLRRACIQTHPHSTPLPHCRGLELCFNIALERLQAAQGPLPNGQPSYSNALVAALKRAQAHQRRGCPEQQQQPLLAVKVELEQLIISILDDPSVSRVMREAGFSSTDVKSHLEEMVTLMASHHSVSHGITDPVRLPLSVSAMDQMGFRLRGGGIIPLPSGIEESKQVLEVLLRMKMRNPVLLGDSAARVDGVIKDVIQHIERGNAPEQLHGVKVISANLSFVTLMNASKEDLRLRFMELNKSVQELILRGGVVLNVGNLQWLLQVRALTSLSAATNQAYRSCQALYPDLESQWELQSIRVGALGSGSLSARIQEPGIDSLALSLLPSSGATLQLSIPGGEGDGEKLTCCPECTTKYEKEALLLRDQEGGKQPDSPQSCSSSVETPSKSINDGGLQSTCGSQPALPLWLQKALPDGSKSVAAAVVEVYDKPMPLAMRLQELQKKWNQACRSLHTERLPRWKESIEMCQQPSGQVSGNPLDHTLSLLRENSTGPGVTRPVVGGFSPLNGHPCSRPITSNLSVRSMQNGTSEQLLQVRAHKDRLQEDMNGCSASMIRFPWQATSAAMPDTRTTEAASPCSTADNAARGHSKLFLRMNPDALGQLCKGLAKKVGWQPGIISTIAKTVMQCRSGLGKRAGAGVSFKGDAWLLFLGHDRDGKRLMAEALAELSFGEAKKPICLTFGKQQQDVNSPATWSLGLSVPSRGKMPLDQLADAVRHNPSSLFYLEDVEQADSMFRASLVRAMSKGRLVDSSGRDVTFSSVIVVMTSSVGLDCKEGKLTAGSQSRKESPHATNEGSTHLQTSLGQSSPVSKRKGSWDSDNDSKERGSSKRANLGLALNLDLNLAAGENDTLAIPVSRLPAQDPCDVLGTSRPELIDDEVLLGARKQLGELCDLVDAAVVFASPL
ncbi:hypothetical protein GOP47_0005576 [Adiantum capillus-veneris]|uniref:Clp R domain-containing protein n=1 Tax=Adiantum capillus-veneris TaxID=13818 RepID=A0A9D4V6Z6_ADICA|nr:hypothetical protein GOP47_0005576 [Adiantum capillus-veneris]